MDSTRYLPFAGRLLIGLPFAMSGLGKLAAYSKTTAMIAAVDATKEFGGVITSSPGPMSSAFMARISASVPELSVTTCGAPR